MTNYLVKRTIAGIMAVLTVAGAVPANVGGFLTGGSVISVGALSGEMSESDDGLVCEVIDTFGVNGTDHTYEGADFNVTAAYSERNAGMYTYDDYYYINIASKTDKVIQKVELRAYTVTGTKGFKAVSGEENDCTADTSGVSKKGDIVTITDIGSSSLKVWGGIFTFDQVRVYYEAPSAQHTYGEPNWQWTDDLRATAVFACNDNDSTVSVEAEVGEPKVTTAPTYTTEGVMTYTASAEFSGKTYTSSKEVPIAKLTLVPFAEAEPNCTTDGHIAYWYDPVKELYFKDAEGTEPISREALVIAKKGHDYAEPDWSWTNDHKASAVFMCRYADDVLTLEAENVVSELTVPPTYSTDGLRTYTAAVTLNGKTYTSTKTEFISRIALTHQERVDPTCETAGNIEYWFDEVNGKYFYDSEGTKPIFDKNDIIIPATEHSYGKPQWDWSEDFTLASAKFVCANSEAHDQTVKAFVEKSEIPATYTTDGVITYTAKVTFGGSEYTDIKTVTIEHTVLKHVTKVDPTCENSGNIEYWFDEVNGKYFYDADGTKPISDKNDIIIPATEHSYGNPQWDWSEDFTSASAKFVCANSEAHDQTVKAVIEKSETPATYTADGAITYTAKVTFGGSEYTDIKTVTIEHIVLKHVAKVDPTCENSGNIEYWFDEVNGKYFYDADGTKPIENAKDIIIPAIEHSYGKPQWDWSEDFTSASAKFVCANSEAHDQTVKAAIEKSETPATYTADGVITYTAKVTFGGSAYTDIKTVTIEHTVLKHVVKVDPTCENSGNIEYWFDEVNGRYFYDADGTKPISDKNDIIIPATEHSYGKPQWDWSEDFTLASAKFVCANSEAHDKIVKAFVEKSETPATYTADGVITYTAKVTFGGSEYTDIKTVTIEHTVLKHVTKVDPTCETAGNIEYWFDEVNGKYFYDADGTKPIENAKDIIVPAVEHSYGKPQWDWSEDFTSASAKFVCANSTEHDQIVKAVIEKSETPATYTADGVITYTAKVTFGGSEYTDIKTVTIEHISLKHVAKVDPTCETVGNIEYWFDEVNGRYFYDADGTKPIENAKDIIIPAIEHSYGNPQWDWSEDFTLASAKFVCANSEAHDQTVKAFVEKSETPATYTADGLITYTAKVTFGGSEYTDIKTVTIEHIVLKHVVKVDPICENSGNIEYWFDEVNGKYFYDADGTKPISDKNDIVIPATEHSYGNPQWDWSEDFTSASAKFVCANSEAHDQTVKAVIEKSETLATYTADGVITYTAKVTFGGSEYTNIKTVTIEHISLKHVAKVDPTCETAGNIEYWVDEVNGKYFYDSEGTKPISDKNDIIIPATEHSYGNPQWDWSEDFTLASAKFVCANSEAHDQTVKAVIEKSETPATYTADGVITYTAKVTFGGSEYTDIKTVTIEHISLKHVVKVDPTCETAGNIEYWFDEQNNMYFSDSEGKNAIAWESTVLAKTGHDFDVRPVWNWNEEKTEATAKFICKNDPNHIEEAEAVVSTTVVTGKVGRNGSFKAVATVLFNGKNYTSSYTRKLPATTVEKIPAKAATCYESGNIEYYAGSDGKYYVRDGEEYKEIELEDTIDPIGEYHTFGAPEFIWNENHTATAKITCEHCGHEEFMDAEVCVKKISPSYSKNGKYVYTASVKIDEVVYTDSREVIIAAPAPVDVAYTSGERSVKLTWNTVKGAEKYAVCVMADGKWKKAAESVADTFTLSGLKPDTKYQVTVIPMVQNVWCTDFSRAITVEAKSEMPVDFPKAEVKVSINKFRLDWTAVEGAEKYGIAVYQAGKWVVKASVDGSATSYTSPKISANTYKMVVCAKVNGKWDTRAINSRAFSVVIK